MRLRIFRAPNLATAMADIRNELGLDALILATEHRDGVVEVTAALDVPDEPELPVAQLEPLPPRPLPAEVPDALRRHGLPPALETALLEATYRDGPERALSRLFRFGPLPLEAAAPPLLLSGPAGAGKTLMVAKLATRMVLEGHTPLVITADDRRAGAVEQLAAFTRLLGLTLIAAGEPDQLHRALRRRDEAAPALIDLPALDARDADDERRLEALVDATDATLALVLPCGLDAGEAAESAAAHAALGARLLVPTRVDRSGRLGGVLAAGRTAGMILTEAGTGPGVVDSLARITPSFLSARLIPQGIETRPAPQAALLAPAPVLAAGSRQGAGDALALHIAAQSGWTDAERDGS